MSWMRDGITIEESHRLSWVRDIASASPELADYLLADWVAQRFSWDITWHLHVIASTDAELAKRILDLPWVADGLEQPESDVLSKLTSRIPVDGEIGRRILDLPWVADGITKVEAEGARSLVDVWRSDRELGQVVLDLPWVADGITGSESVGLWGLAGIAYTDSSLAWQVIDDMEDLLPLLGGLASDSLASLGQLGEFPEDLRQLVEQPWFADGLSREEAAFVTTLMPLAYASPSLYAHLLESHFTVSKTISLPLAGEVVIWAFQNAPFAQDDGQFTVVENAAGAMEGFLGAPFPTNDIIFLLVVPGSDTAGLGIGRHMGSHVRIINYSGGRIDGDPNLIRHELSHYYFGLAFAPVWLREGAADYAAAYVRATSGTQSMDDRSEVVSRSQAGCVSDGIENISHLNRLYDPVFDTPGCAYVMGENFLHQVREPLGEDGLAAALRELYYLGLSRERLWPATEAEIYEVFLRNTPPGREDDFRDVYQRLHGGQYADGGS